MKDTIFDHDNLFLHKIQEWLNSKPKKFESKINILQQL